MADGLINIIQDRLPYELIKTAHNDKYKWIKIHDMSDGPITPYYVKNISDNSSMEILGEKANVKLMRKIDNKSFVFSAMQIIQHHLL